MLPARIVRERRSVNVNEQAEALKERTRRFALDVVNLVKILPSMEPGGTLRRQLTKSANGSGRELPCSQARSIARRIHCSHRSGC